MTEADRKLRASAVLHVLSPAPRPWNICGAWNIAVRTRGVFTHRADFSEARVRRKGPGAHERFYLLRI